MGLRIIRVTRDEAGRVRGGLGELLFADQSVDRFGFGRRKRGVRKQRYEKQQG
jgi:hypothetical protein